MIERLEHLGVQELTLVEQSGVVGGEGIVKCIGKVAGFAVGIVAAIVDRGYDNPRLSGQWVG